MSDRPQDGRPDGEWQQPGRSPTDSGWYVPDGAVNQPSVSNAESIPMPTNTDPKSAGEWYVPPDAVQPRAVAEQPGETVPSPAATPSGIIYEPMTDQAAIENEAINVTTLPSVADIQASAYDTPLPDSAISSPLEPVLTEPAAPAPEPQPDGAPLPSMIYQPVDELTLATLEAQGTAPSVSSVEPQAEVASPPLSAAVPAISMATTPVADTDTPLPSDTAELEPVMTDSSNKPNPASQSGSTPQQNIPEGGKLSTEVDYSNYVPGRGFVSSAEASQPATAGAVQPPDPNANTNAVNAYSVGIPSASPAIREPSAGVVAQPIAPTGPQVAQPAATGAAGLTSDQVAAQLAAQPANPSLTQKFVSVEKDVAILRRRYAAGTLSRDQLQAELRKLMILDEQGHWWMIGMETDRWYRYDGKDWIAATPPGYTPMPGAGLPSAANAASASLAAPSVRIASTTVGPTQIPLDDNGLPLPSRVPQDDPGATMVGRAAPRLDNTLKTAEPNAFGNRLSAEKQAAAAATRFDGGVTVPHTAVAAGPTVPQAAVTAAGAGANAQPVTPAASIPTAVDTRLAQPDYGPKPGGFSMSSQQQAGCIIRSALIGLFLALAVAFLGSIGSILYYTSTINRYSDSIAALATGIDTGTQSVKFFDAGGREIFQLNDPKLGAKRNIPLNEVSPFVIHALIATENERFYQDPGFDVIAITRAVIKNLQTGGGSGGASTITQQLTRSQVLESGAAADISASRKITEILVSSEVARRYTKSQILEYYLNTSYFGNLAYGIEAAAEIYFKKPAKELNLAEASFLVGLIQSPAAYDPALDNGVSSTKRAEIVRGLMLKLGCIQMEHEPYNTGQFCVEQKDLDAAAAQSALVVAQMATFRPAPNTATYPHFMTYVRQLLEEQYGAESIYSGGLNVYTTIDPTIQDAAQQIAAQQVANLAANNVGNAAVVVIRPSDGAILAMVGSVDFNNAAIDGQVNVAISPRQPGSALKPFIYLTAFEQAPDGSYEYPGTVVWDIPTDFNGYQPVNYNGRYNGPVSVRQALAQSLNIPAVKTLETIGIQRFENMAERVGLRFPLTQPEQAGLPMALGGVEVTLMDMVRAYSVLANGGTKVPTYAISKITRRETNQEVTIFEYAKPTPTQVVDPAMAWMITNILSDNAARTGAFGANSPLRLSNGYEAAVKTGTTNDFKDNWTVGYTPQFVVGVWVGNTRGEPMRNTSGITGAAPIWNQVMMTALQSQQALPFPAPADIRQANICADWGTLFDPAVTTQCREQRTEFYRDQLPPPAANSVFTTLQVDTFTGLRANGNCPNFVETRTFLNIVDTRAVNWINSTPQGQAWAASYGLTLPLSQPPTQECPQNVPQPVLQIANITSGQTLNGLVQIQGTVRVPNFSRFEIQVGDGFQPAQFRTVDGPTGAQVENGFIGRWDTSGVPNGDYTLRLIGYDQAGHFAAVTVPVRVNNSGQPIITATPFGFATTQPGIIPTTDPFAVITPIPAFPTTDSNSLFPTFDPNANSGVPVQPVLPTETPIVIDSGNPIFPPTAVQ